MSWSCYLQTEKNISEICVPFSVVCGTWALPHKITQLKQPAEARHPWPLILWHLVSLYNFLPSALLRTIRSPSLPGVRIPLIGSAFALLSRYVSI